MTNENAIKDAYELILSRRSVRRFKTDPVPVETLTRMVDAARLAPSGANLQPFRFLVVTEAEVTAQVFATLKWAAYIAPAGNPPPGREPAAYVILLLDKRVHGGTPQYDAGFAAANLLLAGLADGVAGCVIKAFDPKRIKEIFDLPEHLQPDMVVALGRPDEDPLAVDRSDTVRYWRDEHGRHFVPKKPLSEVMFINGNIPPD